MVGEDEQRPCMVDAPNQPLGQFVQPAAYRNSITGLPNDFATFWNVRPA